MSSAFSPAIQLSRVGVVRGGRWILRDIDWSVPAGACCAILGPNGAGKSTLTRILAAHLWPSSGVCEVLGQRFGEVSLPELRQSIRLVQSAGPYDVDSDLTARQVVLTGYFGTIGLYDAVTGEMERHAEELLRQVGLSHVARQTYATLSSGERVRALIARALAARPKLLLLDEPTAGLDLLAREQVLATIQSLFDQAGDGEGEAPAGRAEGAPPEGEAPAEPETGGASSARQEPRPPALRPPKRQQMDPPTVVLITHHVGELPPATSQVLLLDDGRSVASGAPAEVLRSDTMSRVYHVPLEVRRTHGRWSVHVHPRAWEGLLEGRNED